MNDPVDRAFGFHFGIVHGDIVRLGIDFGSEVGDDAAVDLHAPRRDEFIAVPPGANARMSEVFIQAFHLVHDICNWAIPNADLQKGDRLSEEALQFDEWARILVPG